MNSILFSSRSDEWGTPPDLFEELDKEFHFNLDPCCTEENHMCDMYFTKDQDGLVRDWGGYTVFCNPPYSKINEWVEKCYRESLKEKTIVVLLVPARTDTKWFHRWVYHRSEIRFVRGRLRYGGAVNNSPFPSMIVIFRAGGI